MPHFPNLRLAVARHFLDKGSLIFSVTEIITGVMKKVLKLPGDSAVLLLFSVAVRALVWGVLVDDNIFVANHAGLRMAFGTGDVRMSPHQWQMGLGVVVECGRHPTLRVVAIRAMRLIIFGQELAVMGILVTRLALMRSALEP